MRRFFAIAALALALGGVAQPSLAGEAKPDAAKKDGKPGTNVDMPILVAPVVENSKLIAYAYISSTFIASSPAAAIQIRSKTPFLQDAFIRDLNAAPMAPVPAPGKIDRDALKARLLADARRVAGADKVVGLQFTQIQVTPLRPGTH